MANHIFFFHVEEDDCMVFDSRERCLGCGRCMESARKCTCIVCMFICKSLCSIRFLPRRPPYINGQSHSTLDLPFHPRSAHRTHRAGAETNSLTSSFLTRRPRKQVEIAQIGRAQRGGKKSDAALAISFLSPRCRSAERKRHCVALSTSGAL